jgi:hypothetical protein
MRRATLSAILAGTLLLGAQSAGAITFGTPTGPDAYRNVGAMVVTDGSERAQWCTGSLIAVGVFLTAAHCVAAVEAAGLTTDDVKVNFSHDLADAADIGVTGWSMHPRFPGPEANTFDVAVLLFAVGDTPGGVDPVVVAGTRYLDGLGRALRRDTFVAVGYGVTRTSKRYGPFGLADGAERMSVEQRVRSLAKAWVTFSQNPATGDGGTCYGDSGGPHFHGDTVVSITVVGDRFCRAIDKTYRLDTPWVQTFLAAHLP